MKKRKSNLLLQREILNSRVEIQQRSLQTYAKEIYENIGQVLSLAKLQLLTLNPGEKNSTEKIQSSGKLVGKAITDLRRLTKQLSPDEIIKNGFAMAISAELKRLTDTDLCHAEFFVKGNFYNLDEVKELMVFCILQQIINRILNIHGSIRLMIDYKKNKIEIEVERKIDAEPLLLDVEEMMMMRERLKQINGSIFNKNTGTGIFQIIINK